MFPNLFKNPSYPKIYDEVAKPSENAKQNEEDKKLPEKSQENEEKYAELSVKAFFDFMRTAYQVRESFQDNTVTSSSANNQIDWNALTRYSLNNADNGVNNYCKDNAKDPAKSVKLLQNDSKASPLNSSRIMTDRPRLVAQSQNSTSKQQQQLLNNGRITNNNNNINNNINGNNNGDVYPKATTTTISDRVSVVNKSKSQPSITTKDDCSNASVKVEEEPALSKMMKRCLSDVLHEGLLDSVLPYMIPKSALAQPALKKTVAELKKTLVTTKSLDKISNHSIGNSNSSTSSKEKDKDKDKTKPRRSMEAEVEIHVCDEAKNIKRDFRCPQKLLIQKMCYFADVTAGQNLEEMDISVHCDITIFDWLMRWVKKDMIKKSEWPSLEASNVVPIMVSASFLQMNPLLDSCLSYCHDNMSEILKTSAVLTCLNDNLLTRLADLFTNVEIESIKDKRDKIQSRLFCKLIIALANPKPNKDRGHYASLATLFKCVKCDKNILPSVSDAVPCQFSNVRIDNRGNLHSKHTRDMTWSLNDHILKLRSELRSWRRVYWRLWGDCHFLFCRQCGVYFPVNQMDWCSYHPDNPQFFINEQQRSTPFPLGRFPCCSQRAYRFQAIVNRDGCKFREHVPEITSEREESIVNIFLAYREVISMEAPQLFFPEKITRLVARDPSLPQGKLSCKEVFWWDGIEIAPPRPKLGLLAKIWGGSSLKKPLQVPQKLAKPMNRQVSQATDNSSPISSESCSEEDDIGQEANVTSSVEEESNESEESRGMGSAECAAEKWKKNALSKKRCEGMGSWSSNLTIRYNQDNQRDFEEKASSQMIALLIKRAMLEVNLRSKNTVPNKHFSWNSNTQPIGGTYVKLEAEFLNQITQINKFKTFSQSKGSNRAKSSKL